MLSLRCMAQIVSTPLGPRLRAGEDMLDGAPAGQREAARRALQAKRVELVTGALVSGVERLDARAAPGPPDAGPDAGRRLVHLKASGRAGHEVRPAGLLPVIGVNRTLVSRLNLHKKPYNFVELVDRAGARAPSAQPGRAGAQCSFNLNPDLTLSALQARQPALEADLVLWTAGGAPATSSENASDAGTVKRGRLALPFPADGKGAIETDATLRVARPLASPGCNHAHHSMSQLPVIHVDLLTLCCNQFQLYTFCSNRSIHCMSAPARACSRMV